jgi:hypothetical protein
MDSIVKRIKVAIHLHTHYSWDSNVSPAALLAAARRLGVDCVAITDHNDIDGALEARALGDLRVIVGEEVSTADGHLIGLFLERRVPPGMSAEETCEQIRSQGGVVLAPHPFSTLAANSLKDAVWRLRDRLDAVEVFNAQNPLTWEDAQAATFARQSGLAAYVGMDAHLRWLPATYQSMPDFSGPDDFREALRQAEFSTARVGLRYSATMLIRHYWDKVFSRPRPGFGVRARPVSGRGGPESPAAAKSIVQPTRLS